MSGFSVSVVIPLYNKAGFIKRTLGTVLSQTVMPKEVIIVDDGSTDGGPAAVSDLLHGPVRLVPQANAGPGPARNRGISEASGEWIALLDGDDLWAANHLETLAEVAADYPEASVLATRHARIKATAPLPAIETARHVTGEFDFLSTACLEESLFTSAAAVRRQVLIDVGGFGAFVPGEDIEMWFRLALEYQMARSSRCTSFYTQQTGGLTDLGAFGESDDRSEPEISSTIDRALADPRQAFRHEAIREFRRYRLVNAVKQELYLGNFKAARGVIRACAAIGAKVPRGYQLLSLCPSRLSACIPRLARLRNSCRNRRPRS